PPKPPRSHHPQNAPQQNPIPPRRTADLTEATDNAHDTGHHNSRSPTNYTHVISWWTLTVDAVLDFGVVGVVGRAGAGVRLARLVDGPAQHTWTLPGQVSW